MLKSFFLLLLCSFLTVGCVQDASPITTFILLRHAEKADDGTDDPDLKQEGYDRANRLTQLLKETEVHGIYATSFKRTRNTVAPLAAAKSLEVQRYESFKADAIEKMLEKHRGGTIVVCGHSDNIPWTANLLTGKEELEKYKDADYSIMLILSVVEKGKRAKITRLDF